VVASLHADGDVNHPLVNLQIEEMSESLREEGIMTWRKFFDLRVLFSTRAKRYRLMLSKLASVLLRPEDLVSKPANLRECGVRDGLENQGCGLNHALTQSTLRCGIQLVWTIFGKQVSQR
jgi:hypothetical protein